MTNINAKNYKRNFNIFKRFLKTEPKSINQIRVNWINSLNKSISLISLFNINKIISANSKVSSFKLEISTKNFSLSTITFRNWILRSKENSILLKNWGLNYIPRNRYLPNGREGEVLLPTLILQEKNNSMLTFQVKNKIKDNLQQSKNKEISTQGLIIAVIHLKLYPILVN